MPTAKEPQTDEEWQEAANQAEAFSMLESARMYGLVCGGPTVNINRCLEILERARQRGVYPQREGVDSVVQQLARGGRT